MVKLFGKGFSQSRSANKLFNEANERWHQRQRLLLNGDEERARNACVEVVRLCQLAIEADQRMGDAYVLLANALSSASSHAPRDLDRERYEFLLSRAAAVIHFWYSLPHRGYPTTKNTAIGEQLWKITVDEVKECKALSEDAALALMNSYRDSLAAGTISPASFEKIQEVVLRTVSPSEPSQTEPQGELLDTMLPTEIWNFLMTIVKKGAEKQPSTEGNATYKFPPNIESKLEVWRSYNLVPKASRELLARVEQACQDNDFRQAVGWVTWDFILLDYMSKFWTLDVDLDSKKRQGEVCSDLLMIIVNKARRAKDWNALLLAAGLCQRAELLESRDEIMHKISSEVSAKEFALRLRDMERFPRMVTEGYLLRGLRDFLPKPD